MKKSFVGFLLTLVVAFSSCVFTMNTALTAKADSLDNADRFFVEFLLSDTDYEGDLSFEHSPLYDENLNAYGREYLFTKGEVSGYALLIEFYSEEQTFYEVEELFYNAASPFANCVGLPVYLSHRVYIDYHDGAFYNLENNQVLTEDTVTQIAQQGFKYYGGSGTGEFVGYTQTVSYATKATTVDYTIQFELPDYCGSTGSSSCANTAGAVVIAYYDRFYENLIPNYQSYYTMGPVVIYKSPGAEIISLINTLSDLMLIGEPHEGTTFSEFQLGMETYVESKGLTYSSSSVFLNGSFNLDRYKNAVNNNKPVAIFMMNYAMLGNIVVSDGVDTINSGYSSVSHVVVGCGYRTDVYYDANGNVITTRNYLRVASGILDYGIGYLNINGVTDIRNAISIEIS